MSTLWGFVRESNRIEGILRDPYDVEVQAHRLLLDARGALTVSDMQAFVGAVQPDAILRSQPHLNVQVGGHVAPRGGQQVVDDLIALLHDASRGESPFTVHQRYEQLHPFTDGNGRSGRALWLWAMCERGDGRRALSLGFLHNWYYSSLANWRPDAAPREARKDPPARRRPRL